MSGTFKSGVLFGESIPLVLHQTKKATVMKTADTKALALLATIQVEEECTIDEARTRGIALLTNACGGAPGVAMKVAAQPSGPFLTLSQRTRAIMKESGLSFPAAQREASKAMDWKTFRGRP